MTYVASGWSFRLKNLFHIQPGVKDTEIRSLGRKMKCCLQRFYLDADKAIANLENYHV